MTDNFDPMAVQHGGNHYKGLAIEPFEMTLANQYDGAIHSVLKYVTRHQDKGQAEDLFKAHHITAIRLKYIPQYGATLARTVILPEHYNTRNGLRSAESLIITALHGWSTDAYKSDGHNVIAGTILNGIEQLIRFRYPEADSIKPY